MSKIISIFLKYSLLAAT